jgi:hypothetical protein
MERKFYKSFIGFLAFVAYALALRLLWVWNSFPATLWVRYGTRVPRSFQMPRGQYVAWLALDLVLLPVLCAAFAYAAHRGEDIDLVSWAFVVLFYVILWFLWHDMDAATSQGAEAGGRFLALQRGLQHPLGPIGLASAAGIGFWKWKQSWDSGS